MASTYKTFLSDDIANTRTLLHEAVPIAGTIVNGATYTDNGVETNIKTYAHGMFQSVYDYPYQSSSANHIFDITFGHHSDIGTQGTHSESGVLTGDLLSEGGGDLTAVATNGFYNKRKNIYNQMAQVLAGHEVDGRVRKFDGDGDLTQGNKHNALIFINFARLLGKDEIKKGTFSVKFGTATAIADAQDEAQGYITITDSGAATDYKINSPAGEYGVLKLTGFSDVGTTVTVHDDLDGTDPSVGLIFYQAGIIAITPEVFNAYQVYADPATSAEHGIGFLQADALIVDGTPATNMYDSIAGKTQDQLLTGIRHRILNVSFSNTTELNSTIYFCRAGHNDFNYSTNPTYLDESRIRVKDRSSDAPVSYITSVGLYSSDNELLAVAKLSEPLRKDPTNEINLRVRLDY